MMPNDAAGPQDPRDDPRRARLPLSPRVQDLMRTAAAAAGAAGERVVAPAHVAAALQDDAARAGAGVAGRGRAALGTELAAALRTAAHLAAQRSSPVVDVEHLAAAVSGIGGAAADAASPARRAAQGGAAGDVPQAPQVSPAETERALRVLSRRGSALVAMVGEAGTQPERAAAAVRERIARGRVPHALRGAAFEVFATLPPLQSLGHRARARLTEIAGAGARDPAVVFIPDVVLVLDAPGGPDALVAALLGNVRLLTACDAADAERLRSSPLRRWLRLIPVAEARPDDVQAVVAAAVPSIAAHHGVSVASDVTAATVAVAGHASGSRAPGGALDLLEDACAVASAAGRKTVTVDDVRAVAGAGSGAALLRAVPAAGALEHVEDQLHERIVGQHDAVRAVADAIRRAATGVADPDRPLGSFLFLGPTGVGKTELARALVDVLYGDAAALVRLDMGEYQEPHAVARLVGAPPGYIGYEHGGHLSEALRRRPACVVLLDEIEKAHPDVLNTLLAVLDNGRLTDGYGRMIDARSAVLIMTSNLGGRDILDPALRADDVTQRVQAALEQHFPPEFLSRVDDVVVFRRLSPADIRGIVDLHVRRIQLRLAERDVTVDVGADVRAWLADRMKDSRYGARPLRAALRRHVEDVLARAAVQGRLAGGSAVRLHLDGDAVVVV